MKKTVISLSLIATCFANASFADTQKLEERVCEGKTQNTAVSYAYKGVLFNGTCQPNQHGKLAFQSPQPAGQTAITTQSSMSISSSVNEDLGIDAPILEDEQENSEIDLITEMDQPVIIE